MTESPTPSKFAERMNHPIPIWSIINLVLLVLFLNACTPPPVPSFVGSLIVQSGDSIYKLTSDSTAKNLISLKIAGPDIQLVAFSPDKYLLAYSVGDFHRETRLHDLRTGEESMLFSTENECIRWNKEIDMSFYVYEHELFVYSLSTGQSKLLYTAPSAPYSTTGSDVFGTVPVYGEINCGLWIGSNRFLFRRFVGIFPNNVPEYQTEILADSLTLAILGDPVTFVDSLWGDVIGISNDETMILVERIGGLYLVPAFNDAKSIKDYTINPRRVPNDVRGFVPMGNDLFYVDQTSKGSNQIHFIDSVTLEEHLGPELPADWLDWIWVGDPKENLFAVEKDKGTAKFFVSIIDLDTGGEIAAEVLGSNHDSYILAWLPP